MYKWDEATQLHSQTYSVLHLIKLFYIFRNGQAYLDLCNEIKTW